jgi:hypothetical protein
MTFLVNELVSNSVKFSGGGAIQVRVKTCVWFEIG